MIGPVFLTRLPRANNRTKSLYMCVCGTFFSAMANKIKTGHTRSCGCLQKTKITERNKQSYKIGSSKHSLYATWQGMIQRCYNMNYHDFASYGGRGIKVCDAWRHDFIKFVADVEPKPKNCSLDRIDVNGGYEPSNVRWATNKEQGRNRQKNRRWLYGDKQLTVGEICDRTKTSIPQGTVSARLVLGWSIERAVTEPMRTVSKRRMHSLPEWACTGLSLT